MNTIEKCNKLYIVFTAWFWKTFGTSRHLLKGKSNDLNNLGLIDSKTFHACQITESDCWLM